MINHIVLDDTTAKELKIHESDRLIGELSRLNIFAGKNNAGKSRLIRNLFKIIAFKIRSPNSSETIFFDQRKVSEWNYTNAKDNIKEYLSKKKNNLYRNDPESTGRLVRFIAFLDQKVLNDPISLLNLLKNIPIVSEKDFPFSELDPELLSEIGLLEFLKQNTNKFIDDLSKIILRNNLSALYIPILRGLRPIQSDGPSRFSNNDSFNERTVFDYFKNGNGKNIYTGLSMYEDITKLLLGTEEERQLIADFEKFLSDHIFSEKVTLIPKHDKDVLHIKTGQKPQLEIYNLGDGLQTIISILFPIFIGKDQERLVFIEEPEAHLHPDWQVKLLNALKQIPNQQYFITTHSNAFINDPETKLFSVREEGHVIRVTEAALQKDKLTIINELGYRPSDLLQANFILWVEGYSDKIYLEYWIGKLAPDLKEGINYTVLFFGGGSNIRHLLEKDKTYDLSFVRSINQNLGIILDSDRASENEELKSGLLDVQQHFDENGLFCWITRFREVENYIPHHVFKQGVLNANDKLQNIEVSTGDYDDRNTVTDLDQKETSFKATIKIPQSIFSAIQKNGNGTTQGIAAKTLRKAIEEAIQNTAKSTFATNKILVAKEIAKLQPEIESDELKDKLQELIAKIREANNFSIVN